MKAAQAGDRDAYVELVNEITPRLRGIIHRSRGFLPREDIDDLVQDVLLSLHAYRHTYDSERPFMPWFLAIARHRLADGARRYARRNGREIQLDQATVTFCDELTNTTADLYGDPDALRRAVSSLPLAQRSAVKMVKLAGMSLKEAAAASGMTVGALKTATHRAISALRKALVKKARLNNATR
jgi:RNA polymerase sigma-70 factor (ECF subfamily)